jgi:2-polyprenyl-3-methyl-5-hydroxy-6-metoxy-1,4-benzoquinol methylase
MSRFDGMAENWDNDPQKVKRAETVAGKIRKYIPLSRQMEAMEFGCGTGLLSFALKDDLGHITLVDTSKGMLDVLMRKIDVSGAKNMTPMLFDLTADKKLQKEFDFVFTMMALHHVRQPERVLRAFSDRLKPGGYLTIAELEKGDVSFHGPGFDGHDGFEREKLFVMAEDAGFRTVRFHDCFVVERDIEGTIEKFNVFLLTCRKV